MRCVAFWRTCCLFQDGEQVVPDLGRRLVWLGVLAGIMVILAVGVVGLIKPPWEALGDPFLFSDYVEARSFV